MIRSLLFSIAAANLAMSAPLFMMSSLPSAVLAQSLETPAPDDPTTECFSVYPFGQLSIETTSPAAGASFYPGDIITVAGQIRNPSHAVLPDGKIFVRILLEDATVATEHWHPIVAEFILADIDVPATNGALAGEKSFSSEWQIPAYAPPGAYKVELSLLAGDGSPIVGVPYVANVFGASIFFTVKDGGRAAAAAFDRGNVLFNGAPFAFRAVPPRPEPGSLSIVAPLQAVGNASLSVNVEKSLYSWTDMEGDTLINSATEELVVAPGENAPVSFNWEAPSPGVYELVLKAAPLDKHVLPSLLRVRFYYEGTVPRILHAGMREEKDGSATVAACFFNSTFGPDGGSGKVQVLSDGATVAELSLADIIDQKMATLSIPAATVTNGFTLTAEAKDLQGKVTDTEEVTWPAKPANSPIAISPPGRVKPRLLLVGAALIALLLLSAIVARRRRRKLITHPL